jgi:O-antigen/teichoic acid export membrane protein
MLIVLGGATPAYAILALLASYAAQLALLLSFIKHELHSRLHQLSWIFHNLKAYITASYLGHLLQIISTSLIPILIASISGAKEAGLFAAPMILIDAARASINMVSMHTLPHIAKAADECDRKRRIKHSLCITLFFSVGAALVFYISAAWVLALLFGAEFVQAANILRILAVGLVFICMHNTLLAIIASLFEGVRLVFSSAIVAIASNLICAMLAERYGAMAGAIAFLLGNSAACVAAALCFLNKPGVR